MTLVEWCLSLSFGINLRLRVKGWCWTCAHSLLRRHFGVQLASQPPIRISTWFGMIPEKRESEALLMKEFGPNNEEDTESVGLENGEDSYSCDSRSLSDSGDRGLLDQVNIGVDYRDRDVEDGIDPGLGELGSPEMAILSATVEGERLVTPHPIWLTQKSHWNGEMKNGVECDTIPGADGIVAEEWNEVANMLNV